MLQRIRHRELTPERGEKHKFFNCKNLITMMALSTRALPLWSLDGDPDRYLVKGSQKTPMRFNAGYLKRLWVAALK